MKVHMGNRAIFISLTATVVVAVILVLIIANNELLDRKDDLNIDYVKHKYAHDYVEDIERLYLPSMVSVSLKQSLIALSEETLPVDALSENLTMLVMQGIREPGGDTLVGGSYLLPNLLEESLGTVRSPLEIKHLNFNITGVAQKSPWSLAVDSRVNISVTSEYITWQRVFDLRTDVQLNGLNHPVYHKQITRKWKQNNTEPCFLEYLDSGYICPGGIDGLCPLQGCS